MSISFSTEPSAIAERRPPESEGIGREGKLGDVLELLLASWAVLREVVDEHRVDCVLSEDASAVE